MPVLIQIVLDSYVPKTVHVCRRVLALQEPLLVMGTAPTASVLPSLRSLVPLACSDVERMAAVLLLVLQQFSVLPEHSSVLMGFHV